MSGERDTMPAAAAPTDRPASGVHRVGFTGSQAEAALLLLDHLDNVREYLGCAVTTNHPVGRPVDQTAMGEWLREAMAELTAAEWNARAVIASVYGVARTTPRTGLARELGATVDEWEDALLGEAANG